MKEGDRDGPPQLLHRLLFETLNLLVPDRSHLPRAPRPLKPNPQLKVMLPVDMRMRLEQLVGLVERCRERVQALFGQGRKRVRREGGRSAACRRVVEGAVERERRVGRAAQAELDAEGLPLVEREV